MSELVGMYRADARLSTEALQRVSKVVRIDGSSQSGSEDKILVHPVGTPEGTRTKSLAGLFRTPSPQERHEHGWHGKRTSA
jgi:hypothetical protein